MSDDRDRRAKLSAKIRLLGAEAAELRRQIKVVRRELEAGEVMQDLEAKAAKLRRKIEEAQKSNDDLEAEAEELSKKEGDGASRRDDDNSLDGASASNGQFSLGTLCADSHRHVDAMPLLKSAALQGHVRAARNLFCCHMSTGRHALGKFWIVLVMESERQGTGSTLPVNFQSTRAAASLKLDQERCGACHKPLGMPKQNMCKQCRTCCYCDRSCQIRHWNRGHKIDCKEVGGLISKSRALVALFVSDEYRA